jgi:asparagine synthase (glutamine-hydrolysing)
MCRIAGILDKNSQSIKQDIKAMTDSMKHGGPDSSGVYFDESINLALGHRRLSIIDLSSGGNQPMYDDDNQIVLIFNGEIYNYRDLKEELIQNKFIFKTNSDTEVIINAYKHWGETCFSKFKGMFAIALYDKAKHTLILARDHIGIKPLYYYCQNGALYFASEIRSFLTVKNDWQENHTWKVFFLTYGYLPEPVTTLKDVKPLSSGSYLKINVDTLEQKEYSFYTDEYNEEIFSESDAKDIIYTTLNKAVERHLIADAPIGLFLSGGIDSSLLTLLARNYKKQDLHTLSIVFNDVNFSEKYYQDIIVDTVHSQHQAFTLTKDLFLDSLDDYFKAMDQPSADGINTYFISKYAKQSGLKAVLSGLGADELLGGYASFRLTDMVNASRLLPGSIYKSAEYLSMYKYKKISFLERRDAVGEYLFNRGYFSPVQTAKLLDIDITEVNNLLSTIHVSAASGHLKDGNRVSAFESGLYMKNQLLRDTDIMSMWHGIEVRVPFLDIDFVKAVHGISAKLKFGNKQGKHLLIEAFKDVIPREIYDRKKQGFVFPFRSWITSEHEIFPCKNPYISKAFQNKNLDWSRYWTYQISNTYNINKN